MRYFIACWLVALLVTVMALLLRKWRSNHIIKGEFPLRRRSRPPLGEELSTVFCRMFQLRQARLGWRAEARDNDRAARGGADTCRDKWLPRACAGKH